jgi:GNAT superfamily N-acetyltransferase
MTTVARNPIPSEQSSVLGYPGALAIDAMTRGGSMVHLRPIRPDDAVGLVEFHHALSPESIYRRFFSVHPELSAAEVARFTCVDYVDRFALVAEDGGQLIAVGRYDRTPGTSEAEVAFVVADQHQHRGIGMTLLEHLAAVAWRNGIKTFVASTLADNQEMLHVFADSGFRVSRVMETGIIDVRFPIEPDDAYRAACAVRRSRVLSELTNPTAASC